MGLPRPRAQQRLVCMRVDGTECGWQLHPPLGIKMGLEKLSDLGCSLLGRWGSRVWRCRREKAALQQMGKGGRG